ncbi:class I SAM-dependent methyltransferase [Leptolyngbya sp. 7M]|uniref:class I SAM-dependent methyltransferase n=1 Tax=Leptolyngbya sp. 7M TaxID=2812896 RepID=UPI001B8B13CF|nr:SAM-dependent methyltransferase [Leptolyngbya sp. 7M]QYO67137.1 SAM-dependent methyltransferase [Leptolyngbya sp. 7M]
MKDARQKFIDALSISLAQGTFVKLTLGNYKGVEPQLQKVLVRQIETRKGPRLFVQAKYSQRDIVKNYPVDEGIQIVNGMIESGFRNAHLFTTLNDFQLDIGKRSSRLNIGRPTFLETIVEHHDRKKRYLVDQNAAYLKPLGITNDSGHIRADGRDKWKQMNKFVEVLNGIFRRSALFTKNEITIVDMGSGNGYLTFATYDHFTRYLGKKAKIRGIDLRADLVEKCNAISEACGFDGLRFEAASITETPIETIDVLISLHACDTATDDALYKGIKANAEIIIAAPCCHREVRKQLKPPEPLQSILRHPVLLERTAESITDGIRALLLESAGYSTKMFEFVPTEHTPKNNLLVANRPLNKHNFRSSEQEIAALLKNFGICRQTLYNHLYHAAKQKKSGVPLEQ